MLFSPFRVSHIMNSQDLCMAGLETKGSHFLYVHIQACFYEYSQICMITLQLYSD